MDRINNLREELQSDPPVRGRLEDITEETPTGPLGKVGGGNLLGLAGFFAVESGEVITSPIPGFTRPGFKVVSHGMRRLEDGLQQHEIVIHAAFKDVAEFAVQYMSAPSNFDYLKGNLEVVEVEEIDEGTLYDTYRIVVNVDRQPLD
jgi:hypothetical protein